MSEMKIDESTAQEIRSALQEKVADLQEFGLFLEVQTLYYADDRFCVTVAGMNRNEKFLMLKGMSMIH